MSIKSQAFLLLPLLGLYLAAPLQAADVVFPSLRSAYYSGESIELAVSGLEPG